MKSKKILSSLIVLSLVTSIGLVGCGEKNNSNDGKSESASSDKSMDKDQHLNTILDQEPKTIDQSKSTDSYSSQILTNISEGLTRLEADEQGNTSIEAAGAESWETSEDGLTWTFKIRDMKWSNGDKVTAGDYEYGIKRTINAETGSQYAFLLFPIKNAEAANSKKVSLDEVGVKAVDENTLKITLEKPCPYFLKLTYFKVMHPQNQKFVEECGERYGSEADKMIYCGPYKLAEWSHNNKLELEKNEDYWDKENVKLDKVTMRIIKEESSRMNELYNGSLDMAGVSKQEWIKKLDETGEYKVIKGYDGSATYTYFNQNDKYFKNQKIRQAFMLAEDRQGSVDTLFRGLAEPAMAWCPPQVAVGDSEFRKVVGDDLISSIKEKNSDPKALLIEGLKEEGLDPDPSKHNIKYLQSGTDARSKEFAEFSQQNYKNVLGVNIQPEYCEWAIFQSRTDQMDYQIASQAWTGDYNDPNTFFDMFLSNAGIVPSGWKSEKYDNLIEEANNITDNPEERAKKFLEAEKILLDETVISPGVWRFKNTYVRNYVKNYTPKIFGTVDFKGMYISGRNK